MQEYVALAQHSTMGLGGTARYLTDLTDVDKLPELLAWAQEHDIPVIMIGSGSNIIWKDEGFPGLVIVNKLLGFEVEDDGEDSIVTVASGEPWDSVVERCCDLGLSGIAELSLIPGTTGATPVQNVGAYGREIADVLVSLTAYDLQSGKMVELDPEECGFNYRTSRFKATDRGRFFITEISMQLSKSRPAPPYYQPVSEYFAEHEIIKPSVQDLRMAVVAIRSAKLPDPAVVANNGSFFGNPIITKDAFAKITAAPGIKHWVLDDGTVKVSAAWLIEAAGFKDYHDKESGMATWPSQPLVFINEAAKNTADLLRFKQKIVDAVQAKFGIELQQEPELLPV